MNNLNYPDGQLHLRKLSGGSDVDMTFYVNKDIETVAINHSKVIRASKGVKDDGFRVFSLSTYRKGHLQCEELPSSGVIIEFSVETGFNPTEAVCNMAQEWAMVFGADLQNTIIGRQLGTNEQMSVNELIMEDLPAGYVDTFDDELRRVLASSS